MAADATFNSLGFQTMYSSVEPSAEISFNKFFIV